MGHTVMCVCTVYFTAIVGCAFSSPRLTSGENQQDDKSEKEPAVELLLEQNDTLPEEDVDNEDKPAKTFSDENLDDTGGGENISIPRNETDGAISENRSLDLEITNGKHFPVTKPVMNLSQMQELIKNRHLEGIKEQIMAKLKLPYAPKLNAPMPQLPMDEIEKVYFGSSNDEGYRAHSHYYAKTVRKFIIGQDGELPFNLNC